MSKFTYTFGNAAPPPTTPPPEVQAPKPPQMWGSPWLPHLSLLSLLLMVSLLQTVQRVLQGAEPTLVPGALAEPVQKNTKYVRHPRRLPRRTMVMRFMMFVLALLLLKVQPPASQQSQHHTLSRLLGTWQPNCQQEPPHLLPLRSKMGRMASKISTSESAGLAVTVYTNMIISDHKAALDFATIMLASIHGYWIH